MTEVAETPQQASNKPEERRNPQRLKMERSMRVNAAWLKSLDERVTNGLLSSEERTSLINLALLKREMQRDKARGIDGMTGLYRQELISEELDRLIEKGEPFAILQSDLDEFGQINKKWGQSAGDEIIIQAALRLRERLREQEGAGRDLDMPFKKGGDEVLVILPGINDIEQLKTVTDKIRNSITGAPFQIPLSSDQIALTASIGGAIWRGEDRQHLLQKADQNMLQAKQSKGTAVLT